MGAGWGAGTAIELPNNDNALFTVERCYKKGPFSKQEIVTLDALRPHLGRAAYLAGRMALRQAEILTTALEAVGTAAAVVRRNGQLMATNTQMDGLIPSVFIDRQAKFMIVDEIANRSYQRAFYHVTQSIRSAEVVSIPIKSAGEFGRGMVIHVMPVRRAAHDIFSGGSCIVLATTVGVSTSPRANILSALFDLTPAEAQIAGSLAALKSSKEIAQEKGVSWETVRSQMRRVFDKTGVANQQELVLLVNSIR